MNITTYQTILKDRVLVFDGAMGTNLQRYNPTVDDYDGHEGCTEMLLRKKPAWIESVHASFFEVGCDIVETNSFGANAIVLGEYGLSSQAHALNVEAAKLAKKSKKAEGRKEGR